MEFHQQTYFCIYFIFFIFFVVVLTLPQNSQFITKKGHVRLIIQFLKDNIQQTCEQSVSDCVLIHTRS